MGGPGSGGPRFPYSPDQTEEEDIADAPTTTIEKFMKLLETFMLEGRGENRLRKWATEEMGVPLELFNTMHGEIKLSWKQKAMSVETFTEQRDLARARYMNIYKMAMHGRQYKAALSAIEGIVKLDGLQSPEILQLTLGATTGQGQITNSARDQVAQLVNKMKQLAETRATNDAILEKAVERIERGDVGSYKRVIDVKQNEDGEIEGKYPDVEKIGG